VGLDDADRMMEAALALVGGEPFTVPASRHWAWVSSRTEFANRAEVLATSQAVHLCLRYRRLGELRSAQRVCELGLLAAPLDEDLTAALVDVLLEQGKPSLARRLVENWETRIRGLECGEPAPALRQRLGESPVPGRRQDGGHWTRS
jgi:hypothetical protein